MGIASEQLYEAQVARQAKQRDDLLDLTSELARSRAGHYEAYFALDWIARDEHGTADALRSMARRWADDALAALKQKATR
jgi:hypothetical protein